MAADMSREHTIEFQVRPDDIDQMGVVHHSRYLTYFDLGREELLRDAGLAAAANGPGAPSAPALRLAEIDVRFLAPARHGDTLRLTTAVAELRTDEVVFKGRLIRIRPEPQVVLAEATMVAAAIWPDGRPRPLAPHEAAALRAAPPQ